jgi:hypothetical protein
MSGKNKLECIPWQAFPTSLKFVSKAGAYPNEASSRVCSWRNAQTWKGMPGKRSSLLQTFVNYCRKKFYKIGPYIKQPKYLKNLNQLIKPRFNKKFN